MDISDDIFGDDPIFMKSFIGKTVHITTVDNENYTGVMYVIDPIYKTLVLHTNVKSEEDYETTLIFRHALKSLRALSEEELAEYLSKDKNKLLLKKWLLQKAINVQEVGDILKIDDQLIIMPPYKGINCICTNAQFLEEIQNIISSMPTDFQ